jgi:D-3-phosphoglycerate dehydrogenase
MAERIVAVLGSRFGEESPEAAALRAAGATLRFWQPGTGFRAITEADLIEAGQNAWAIYGGWGPFNGRVFSALPTLRYVQVLSVGYNHIDVDAATEHGVAVANNPLFCREEVADHAAMLIFAAARRLPKQLSLMREQGWDTRAAYAAMTPTPRVKGSTLGFIAFGAIARLTAHKLRNFGLRYLAYDPYQKPEVIREHGAEPVSLDELCRQSDIMSMHALLNEETRGMLREEHFRQMKPTAWVVNTSRGATIHEASLIRALQEGWIGGACLDVVEVEPPAKDNPLLSMPNVLVTPHTAGYSEDAQRDAVEQSVAETVRVLKGEWPQALVNPAVKETGGIW